MDTGGAQPVYPTQEQLREVRMAGNDNRGPGSEAWQQPENNTHVLALQGGTAAAAGPVTLDYYGHSAFKITTPAGLTLLFDPWRNDPSGAFGLWFGRPFPRETVDVCLSTHAHFDHDAIYHVAATSILDRAVGTWSFADVTVTGVADKHGISSGGFLDLASAVRQSGAEPGPPDNPGGLDMVTYVVETGGVRILIWGDNRHDAPDDVWARWGRIDVLTLPIDGSRRILSYAQADEVVARLKPRIVIPTHYAVQGTTVALSMLRSAQEWVDAQPAKRHADGARLVLDAAALAGKDREVHYFGDHVA